jgi:hypothetical protein
MQWLHIQNLFDRYLCSTTVSLSPEEGRDLER